MKTFGITFYNYFFLIILIPVFIISGCKDDDITSFVDDRDGKTYKVVTIGDQLWMAENLNYAATSGNYYCYEGIGNCAIYGRLYEWERALTVAPDGWHLPSDSEWQQLIDFLGGLSVAGGKLKEDGLAHWDAPNLGADNSSGFMGLPGGLRSFSGSFEFLGETAAFWSSSQSNISNAWSVILETQSAQAYLIGSNKENAYSVRCVKD